MNWKRTTGIIVVLTLLVVLGPVFVARLPSPNEREFETVKLAETSYQEVAFRNETQDVDLAGMLFVPEGPGPFPAAVIIHGSGTSRRDNGWYLTLTRHLQREGIAVLLPDKRGSEKSGGEWRTASLEDLATDTLAAVSFLQQHDRVALSRIGIVGLSQGGQVAPIAASQSNDIDFVVNVVGSGVPLRDQLIYEENHNLRQMGFLPGVSNLFAWFSTSYLVHVGQKDFWEAVGEFDPLPYWEKVTAPTLMLYGAEDTNVNSAKSSARICGLAKPNMAVEVYEGSGHALEEPVEMGNQIFRPDALGRISQFVLKSGEAESAPN